MSSRLTAEEILDRMGFPASAEGPYVDELRAHVRKQVAGGITYRSGGTWAPDEDGNMDGRQFSADVRAKAILALEWGIPRHSYRQTVFDRPICWRLDTRTMKRRLDIDWKRIPAWLGDRWRELGMRWRVWIDTRRGITNPYA